MDHRVSRNIVVKIESVIVDDKGDATDMTLYTEAKHSKQGQKSYLMYLETELSGMEGTKTLLSYDGEQLHIKRYGTVNSDLSVRPDEWVDNVYKTPYGLFLMKTYGKTMVWEDEGDLLIDALYELELENGEKSEVRVKISAQGE